MYFVFAHLPSCCILCQLLVALSSFGSFLFTLYHLLLALYACPFCYVPFVCCSVRFSVYSGLFTPLFCLVARWLCFSIFSRCPLVSMLDLARVTLYTLHLARYSSLFFRYSLRAVLHSFHLTPLLLQSLVLSLES